LSERKTLLAIVAASRGYDTEASAEKGIESVKSSAAGAVVVDNTIG
jgi:uncharacterized protein YegP (UPF0339 family)